MSDGPNGGAVEGDCTLPPDHPLPADELGRYSPERDYNVGGECEWNSYPGDGGPG
jgi:hypothetical protein